MEPPEGSKQELADRTLEQLDISFCPRCLSTNLRVEKDRKGEIWWLHISCKNCGKMIVREDNI